MDRTEREIQRGERAEQILNDPIFVEAFEETKQELVSQWENSPARDVEGREKLWLSLKLLQKVHGQLSSVMETGQLAKASLAQRVGGMLNPFS